MITRLCAWFFSVLAVLLLALGGYLRFAPTPGPALEVPAADLEIRDSYAGEKREVAVRLHNHSSRPMRMLGIVTC